MPKKKLKAIQQQQQSSIAGTLTATTQSQTSLIQVSAVSPIATQETFDSNTSGGARGGLGWAKPTLKCFEPTQKIFKVSEKIDDLLYK